MKQKSKRNPSIKLKLEKKGDFSLLNDTANTLIFVNSVFKRKENNINKYELKPNYKNKSIQYDPFLLTDALIFSLYRNDKIVIKIYIK
jgi:hypothetical protein